MLSLVIPTLNAAHTLEATLAPVRDRLSDIVVVDGGSTDGTVELARALGVRVVESPPGRGRQLHAGALAAQGDWLLFLHGDTVLDEGWLGAVRAFMISPKAKAKAAAFRLRFSDPSPQARRVEAMANWRARILGLPYGDQGLLMSRHLYDLLGGYKPYPLMEDVDIVRRIRRPFITILAVDAVTSAEKYHRDGWWARPFANLGLLILFLLGASPETLAGHYK